MGIGKKQWKNGGGMKNQDNGAAFYCSQILPWIFRTFESFHFFQGERTFLDVTEPIVLLFVVGDAVVVDVVPLSLPICKKLISLGM